MRLTLFVRDTAFRTFKEERASLGQNICWSQKPYQFKLADIILPNICSFCSLIKKTEDYMNIEQKFIQDKIICMKIVVNSSLSLSLFDFVTDLILLSSEIVFITSSTVTKDAPREFYT